MAKPINPTEEKIRSEIERLEKIIEADNIRISTLRNLLPQDVVGNAIKYQKKADKFVLTVEAMKVLKNHRGQFLSSNDIYTKIINDCDGYHPNEKSLGIYLGGWVKEGKLKKNGEVDGYMLP